MKGFLTFYQSFDTFWSALLIHKLIVKTIYIAPCILFRTRNTIKLVFQFLIPLRMSYLFSLASWTSLVPLIYWKAWFLDIPVGNFSHYQKILKGTKFIPTKHGRLPSNTVWRFSFSVRSICASFKTFWKQSTLNQELTFVI